MTAIGGREGRTGPGPGGALPPGQFRVTGFPRFGTHLHRPPPAVPDQPSLTVGGDVVHEITVPLADLLTMGRREFVSDFHCVSGWSATGLRWEGISFTNFYRRTVEAALAPGAVPTHVSFIGLDGYRAVAQLQDALKDDVVLADQLNGAPLPAEHGAPLRLVSPSQYGYMSTKHLCRIEVHTRQPRLPNPAAIRLGPVSFRTRLVDVHPRARVWHEERHPRLPAWLLRPFYRLLVGPIRVLSARGSREDHSGSNP